jgi:hypothetical protein
MFKDKIKAAEVRAPFNTYDSLLELAKGNDPTRNATLTLQLRVELNFVDSKRAPKGPGNSGRRVLGSDGKWYAQDAEGWRFPLLDWSRAFKEKFRKGFQKKAEKVWNQQFLLLTPSDYEELDHPNFRAPPWRLRPNVLCLFQLEFAETNVHRTINVYNLNLRTRRIQNVDTVTYPKGGRVGTFDSGTWASDETNYDDRDLFAPYVWNAKHKVMHDTIGHEIGHALGQEHILPLRRRAGNYVKDKHSYRTGTNRIAPATGDLMCETPADGQNALPCYGTKQVDQFNIMGSGDRIYMVNAISWRERIALHTDTKPSDWGVTGQVRIPPRMVAVEWKPW